MRPLLLSVVSLIVIRDETLCAQEQIFVNKFVNNRLVVPSWLCRLGCAVLPAGCVAHALGACSFYRRVSPTSFYALQTKATLTLTLTSPTALYALETKATSPTTRGGGVERAQLCVL